MTIATAFTKGLGRHQTGKSARDWVPCMGSMANNTRARAIQVLVTRPGPVSSQGVGSESKYEEPPADDLVLLVVSRSCGATITFINILTTE
jgi:hypothetical protein